jgi:GT2 family glycosyltransferase
MRPLVSIIVPVYNGASVVSACIESLLGQNYPQDKFEILIVDNNSNDNTKSIIKRYPVKYIFEEKRGPAAARNRGIKESKGEFIAFTDADCLADKTWLTNLMNGFDKDYIVGCAGDIAVYPHGKTWVEETFIASYNAQPLGGIYRYNFLTEYKILPYAAGCNVVYRKKLLEEIGLFDESLFWSEDLDMAWRVILTGHHLRYIPDALVYHRCRNNLARYYLRIFRSRYGLFCYFKKYPWIDNKSAAINHLQNIFSVISCLLRFIKASVKRTETKQDKINRQAFLLSLVENWAIFLGDIFWAIWLRAKKFSIFLPPLESKVYWWLADKDVSISRYENGVFFRYQLQGIAAEIWGLLHEAKTRDDIVDIINNGFDADREKIEEDVDNFIDQLKKDKLLKS